jgi:hypothetical protein
MKQKQMLTGHGATCISATFYMQFYHCLVVVIVLVMIVIVIYSVTAILQH